MLPHTEADSEALFARFEKDDEKFLGNSRSPEVRQAKEELLDAVDEVSTTGVSTSGKFRLALPDRNMTKHNRPRDVPAALRNRGVAPQTLGINGGSGPEISLHPFHVYFHDASGISPPVECAPAPRGSKQSHVITKEHEVAQVMEEMFADPQTYADVFAALRIDPIDVTHGQKRPWGNVHPVDVAPHLAHGLSAPLRNWVEIDSLWHSPRTAYPCEFKSSHSDVFQVTQLARATVATLAMTRAEMSFEEIVPLQVHATATGLRVFRFQFWQDAIDPLSALSGPSFDVLTDRQMVAVVDVEFVAH